MSLTRRTPRFGELAERVEERLAQLGIGVDSPSIDEELRGRVRAAAVLFGVTDRTALGYLADHVADEIAKAHVLAARGGTGGVVDPDRGGPGRRHLRVVR